MIRMGEMAPDLEPIAHAIGRARRSISGRRAVLVAVTGIDGCGKGFVTARLADALRARGCRVAVIGVDGWLNLPSVRFNHDDPAGHFYRNAIRFGPLFSELVLPLRDRRSLRVEVEHVEETATRYQRRLYQFEQVEVVLLEGIFLLKPALRGHYDLSCWIECGFDTALGRAVARAQEGLSPEATVAAYQRIYFPAQRIHLERDRPRTTATTTIHNDAVPAARHSGDAGVAGRTGPAIERA